MIKIAFCDDDFKGFDRKRLDVKFVCFSDYDPTIPNKTVAFEKISLTNTFGEYLAANGKTQARIAETEKYAHVTFFFNGGVEAPNPGEERILVNSPKVATYDLKPEMSAYEVAEKLVDAIKSLKYDVIIINFANPDMVGHTGILDAAVKAVEAVDTCLGRTVDAILKMGGSALITADHGNADHALNDDGTPNPAHSLNPVPFIYVSDDKKAKVKDGRLADVAPSVLHVMGLPQPSDMTGTNLIAD